MKYIPMLLMLLLAPAAAKERVQTTNNLFDDYEIKTVAPRSILIEGEVQDPGPVDLNPLPLRNAAVKELAFENGKRVFKGAFFVSGYALCDILNGKAIKKSPENTFGSPVDMYVIVENDKGAKTVFSWGEIYYRESYDLLVARSVQPVYPARAKASYPLPQEPRLICGSDLLNFRFLDNPTKITVKSFHGPLPAVKPKDVFSPEIAIAAKSGSAKVGEIGSSAALRKNISVLYGHGMGFREALDFAGYSLKDLIADRIPWSPENARDTIAVVSAKDGYRSVFSASEIMNRGDDKEILLNDLKDQPNGGRYTLIVTGDFFADRNVKSVEKIELIRIAP